MIKFIMPSLGAAMEEGTLIAWKKKPGDIVKRGDIIAEVETQKGLIEIEVFDEGTIQELLVLEGTKVPVGTVMALINPITEPRVLSDFLTSYSVTFFIATRMSALLISRVIRSCSVLNAMRLISSINSNENLSPLDSIVALW